MRIECIALRSATTGESLESSSFISIGTEYVVLEMLISNHKGPLFRVISDEGDPVLFETGIFVLKSNQISAMWELVMDPNGNISFGPSVWAEAGYWERFYDGDPAVVDGFWSLVRRIIAEEESATIG